MSLSLLREGSAKVILCCQTVLEEVLRDCNSEKYGMNISGNYLKNIRFADGILLLRNIRNEV